MFVIQNYIYVFKVINMFVLGIWIYLPTCDN